MKDRGKNYEEALNRFVDIVYAKAASQEITLSDLARRSGLCHNTVTRLQTRATVLPQFRTVYLLAVAVGLEDAMFPMLGRHRRREKAA